MYRNSNFYAAFITKQISIHLHYCFVVIDFINLFTWQSCGLTETAVTNKHNKKIEIIFVWFIRFR